MIKKYILKIKTHLTKLVPVWVAYIWIVCALIGWVTGGML